MSDDEKWYTYPEDEQPEGQSPNIRQRKILLLGVLIGLGLSLLLGVTAYLLFAGGGENIALPSFDGLPRSMVMPGIIGVLVLVIAVIKVAGSRSTWSGGAPQYPRQFEGNPATRIIIVLVIGLIVLGLGIVMLYMQL